MTLDYYTPPNLFIFNDIKKNCIEIWQAYDDTYGYATEKIERVREINNIKDNCLGMVAMFDVDNMRKLLVIIEPESKTWLEPFLQKHFDAELELLAMGIKT